MVVSAERAVSGQRNVVFKSSSSANANVGADHTVVADADVFIEFRSGINNGGMGYDRGHTNQLSRVMRIGLWNTICLFKQPSIEVRTDSSDCTIAGPFGHSTGDRFGRLSLFLPNRRPPVLGHLSSRVLYGEHIRRGIATGY